MKKITTVFISVCCFFMPLSCCLGTNYVAITVHNQSDHDVTDVFITAVGAVTGRQVSSLSLLKKEEAHRFDLEWRGSSTGSFFSIIEYCIDEKIFNTEHQEDSWLIDYDDADDRWASPRSFLSGAKVEIFIKNEGYEFVVPKGAVEWSDRNYFYLDRLHPPRQ